MRTLIMGFVFAAVTFSTASAQTATTQNWYGGGYGGYGRGHGHRGGIVSSALHGLSTAVRRVERATANVLFGGGHRGGFHGGYRPGYGGGFGYNRPVVPVPVPIVTPVQQVPAWSNPSYGYGNGYQNPYMGGGRCNTNRRFGW